MEKIKGFFEDIYYYFRAHDGLRLILILVAVVVVLVVGCGGIYNVSNKNNQKLEVTHVPDINNKFVIETHYADGLEMYVVVDKSTGVNYLSNPKGSITPRYNADGSLFITEVGE